MLASMRNLNSFTRSALNAEDSLSSRDRPRYDTEDSSRSRDRPLMRNKVVEPSKKSCKRNVELQVVASH